MFDKLKGLFSGSTQRDSDSSGLYCYIKLDKTGEVVRIRLALDHELNWDDDTESFVSRKAIIGPQTFARADAVFRLDSAKKLVSVEIAGGESVTEEVWQEQTMSNPAQNSAV